MIPIFVALFLVPLFTRYYIVGFHFAALGVFILACLTDMLDGYVARKYNQVTDLGKFLDPIADKILVMAALVLFSIASAIIIVGNAANASGIAIMYPIIAIVCTILILSRELFIGGFRMVAASKNINISADKLGKIKTIFQMTALIILIPVLDIYILIMRSATVNFWDEKGFILYSIGMDIIYIIGYSALIIATILTFVSGIAYIVKHKEVLKTDKTS